MLRVTEQLLRLLPGRGGGAGSDASEAGGDGNNSSAGTASDDTNGDADSGFGQGPCADEVARVLDQLFRAASSSAVRWRVALLAPPPHPPLHRSRLQTFCSPYYPRSAGHSERGAGEGEEQILDKYMSFLCWMESAASDDACRHMLHLASFIGGSPECADGPLDAFPGCRDRFFPDPSDCCEDEATSALAGSPVSLWGDETRVVVFEAVVGLTCSGSVESGLNFLSVLLEPMRQEGSELLLSLRLQPRDCSPELLIGIHFCATCVLPNLESRCSDLPWVVACKRLFVRDCCLRKSAVSAWLQRSEELGFGVLGAFLLWCMRFRLESRCWDDSTTLAQVGNDMWPRRVAVGKPDDEPDEEKLWSSLESCMELLKRDEQAFDRWKLAVALLVEDDPGTLFDDPADLGRAIKAIELVANAKPAPKKSTLEDSGALPLAAMKHAATVLKTAARYASCTPEDVAALTAEPEGSLVLCLQAVVEKTVFCRLDPETSRVAVKTVVEAADSFEAFLRDVRSRFSGRGERERLQGWLFRLGAYDAGARRFRDPEQALLEVARFLAACRQPPEELASKLGPAACLDCLKRLGEPASLAAGGPTPVLRLIRDLQATVVDAARSTQGVHPQLWAELFREVLRDSARQATESQNLGDTSHFGHAVESARDFFQRLKQPDAAVTEGPWSFHAVKLWKTTRSVEGAALAECLSGRPPAELSRLWVFYSEWKLPPSVLAVLLEAFALDEETLLWAGHLLSGAASGLRRPSRGRNADRGSARDAEVAEQGHLQPWYHRDQLVAGCSHLRTWRGVLVVRPLHGRADQARGWRFACRWHADSHALGIRPVLPGGRQEWSGFVGRRPALRREPRSVQAVLFPL